jgi:hypothetical protein
VIRYLEISLTFTAAEASSKHSSDFLSGHGFMENPGCAATDTHETTYYGRVKAFLS